MIQIRDLLFRYPRSPFVLRIEEMTVAAGEKIAFVGPSGSGKTTLLNLISGINVPEQGSVAVADFPINQKGDAERRSFRIATIGFVFQQFELLPYLNLLENVLLPYRINQALTMGPMVRQRALALAEQVGIADKIHRFPSQLSQGEQQRTALCRAVIAEPKLILADEPTGNLDDENKRLALELLFEQSREHNATLVVVTHDMGILSGFDRVVDFRGFRAREVAE
ncbi:MAG: ABC transporter ATP-binding protein [Pirellulaceae bacterium]|nr:ABC transporter ATP-binding protein [Pirellulaceae bacterium]